MSARGNGLPEEQKPNQIQSPRRLVSNSRAFYVSDRSSSLAVASAPNLPLGLLFGRSLLRPRFLLRSYEEEARYSFSGNWPPNPDHNSVGSEPKRSRVGPHGSSSRCKDFLRKFVDSEILTANLEDWLLGISEKSEFGNPTFDVPFKLAELQNFDYALEGVSFQQLIRMPSALCASTSDAVEVTAHLAIEDFLHASVKGLWETFWGHNEPVPFSVACIHSTSSKFYRSC